MLLWKADVAEQATPDEQARALRDVALAKRIGEHLERQYSGHVFRVEVDSHGGIAKISHPLLPQTWCYVVHLSRLDADPSMKCITKAGGELLERFFQPRGRRRSDLWDEASSKYHRMKHGILSETNWKTGRRKLILPQELAR